MFLLIILNLHFPTRYPDCDLLYFTTQATRVRHEQHKCNMSTTQVRYEWHECNTSANMHTTRTTRVRHKWKFLILIRTQVKTYFHTPILAIRQTKDYKEKKISFWELPFENASFPFQKTSGKCTTKTELGNG